MPEGFTAWRYVAPVAFLLMVRAASAQPADPDTAGPDRPAGAQHAILPTAFYTPETSVAVGGLYARVWKAATTDSVRESSLAVSGTYTFRNQVALSSFGEYQPSGAWLLSSTFTAALSWPDRFYAVGNAAGEDDWEEWTARRVEAGARALRRLGSLPLFAGPTLAVGYSEALETEEGGRLDTGAVPGGDTHTVVGAGVALTWDSRDASVWPRAGSYHTGSLTAHTSVAGEDYPVGRVEVDLRWYRGLGDSGVLAARTRVAGLWGEVPFTMHAAIGGLNGGLRGVLETRYADRAAALAVLEYRRPLVWRLGAVAFAGAGRVAPGLDALSPDDLHWGVGAGLRFALLEASRLNVGVDLAFGGESSTLYINLGEAF